MTELELLSALIDYVYQAATDASLWPDVVARACAWLDSPKGMLYTPLHGPAQGGIYFQHGLTDFFLALYKSRYQSVDLWTQKAVQRQLFVQGEVIIGTDLVPQQDLVASPWYRDCLQIGDISHLLTSVVFGATVPGSNTPAPDMPTACSFYRGAAGAPYEEADRRKLALLLPHLSRSLGVMTRLRQSDLRVAASLSALDQLPTALLLMRGTGEILFSNRAAAALFGQTDAIAIRPVPNGAGLGRLQAKSARVNQQLARALSTAKKIDDVLHFSSAIKVPLTLPGQELLIQLSRVRPGSAFGSDGVMPEVIAFISDPHRPLHADLDGLGRVYGLTLAEARLAVAATGAGSLNDLADQLTLSINTVKTQLKQVYAKTGVRSRAELVRLVLGLAASSPPAC